MSVDVLAALARHEAEIEARNPRRGGVQHVEAVPRRVFAQLKQLSRMRAASDSTARPSARA